MTEKDKIFSYTGIHAYDKSMITKNTPIAIILLNKIFSPKIN